ncbi:hypothetical protein RUM43_009120 [Polyplax serrata]|uniref:Uncharacterized protein n=1 Tax=Polyplax serrata TaxID=468196 RepID=A0AAN8S1V2_POLSC
MGVHGLWKLLEPSGQMVPLESLAGKVIAVDVSIWLHQAIKGMHDTYGAPVGTAHLIVLFHRLCKLLYYKIKPVFVFDGGVPALKHQTLAARRNHSNAAKTEVLKVREKLIKNLLKHEAVRQVLSNETASAALGLNSFALPGPSVEEDLYKLPPIATDCTESASSEASEVESDEENAKHLQNIHSIDVTSQEFVNLPAEVRHDILTEMIETRKQSSWKYLDSMPKNSDNFSDFQMSRLLKRHAVQTSLEKAGKEMGGRALSIQELESILNDKGVLDDLPSKRIAQDNVTRYMLVQRNSNAASGNVEGIQREAEPKTFDVMNHLDDVEWSSDSDVDVIAGKLPKMTERNNKSREERKENEPKSSVVSGQPKVEMTDEIVDILNILEGDKVNEKPLQTKSRLEINLSTIKEEIVEELEPEKPVIKLEELEMPNKKDSVATEKKIETGPISFVAPARAETETAEPKLTEVPQSDVNEICAVLEETGKVQREAASPGSSTNVSGSGEEITPSEVLSSQNSTSNVPKEIISPEVLSCDTRQVLEEVDTTLKDVENTPTCEALPKNINSEVVTEELKVENNIKTPPGFSSSSDSESDFIPIMGSDFEKKQEPTVRRSPDQTNESGKDSRTLSITIKPSNMSESDDLFADVFQSEQQPKEVEEIEKVEVTDDASVSENQTQDEVTEFQKEFVKEVSSVDLNELKDSLEEKQHQLLFEQGRQERQGLNPTDQMYTDAQEMLKLFGVPYVVAPMEAEAQCAVLNTLGLTEGTITEDSDIWLFGGQVVYKNFFNQAKHVLEYTSVNIHKYFKLNREDLIRMAMLVGSDYTVGLNGIGPVTALEILASFPSTQQSLLEGLEKFRDWFTGRNKTASPRHSLKRKIRNTVISSGFPSRAVADAYLHPQVDDSREPFTWAKPNLDLIRKYVKMKMGWSLEKCNNLLLPVVKKMEENTCQSIMEKYFKSVPKTVGVLSKRVESAIKRLEGTEESEETNTKPKVKRKRRTVKSKVPTECSETAEETREDAKRQKIVGGSDETISQTSQLNKEISKVLLINERLHSKEKIPQKEKAQKLAEERKKQAIEIYRMVRGKGKKKKKEFAKAEAKLSESSSSQSD